MIDFSFVFTFLEKVWNIYIIIKKLIVEIRNHKNVLQK